MKVKEMSWFQKGSFCDTDSVPTRVLRLGFSDRSLTWLVLAPISPSVSLPSPRDPPRVSLSSKHLASLPHQIVMNWIYKYNETYCSDRYKRRTQKNIKPSIRGQSHGDGVWLPGSQRFWGRASKRHPWGRCSYPYLLLHDLYLTTL